MNNKINTIKHKSIKLKANLGMDLEKDINITNKYYLDNNIAVIYKKPTPVSIVKVNYPLRSQAKIIEAYYSTPSTTDYNGVYKGRYIDFDVKVTSMKTSFPLSNIQNHQVEHLRKVNHNKGIAFLIIHWKFYDKYYLVPIKIILKYWDKKRDGRKSIPYVEFLNNTYEISYNYLPRLDYLTVIDHYLL